MSLFNALVRTHHITSKKKIAKLRQAASKHNVLALLRSGGSPGIMYVEGCEKGVREWVDVVHNLRYKDYHLAIKPAQIAREEQAAQAEPEVGTLRQIDTVGEFAQAMKDKGVFAWWRRGMGFESNLL